MIKELLNLWSDGQSLIQEMNDLFDQMLDIDKKLYHSVTDALFLGGNLTTLKDSVYSNDSKVNKLEQLIRRKIVTSLSVDSSSSPNITTSLIFMSVVKDAERIGDYAKNIFEVFQKTSKLEQDAYHDRILVIRNEIVEVFDKVKVAFRESDVTEAKKILQSLDDSKKKCDTVVDDLLDKQTAQNAVAYALLARFFKRTLGHLSNIVTSIIMPLDKLDYFDEDHIHKLEKKLKNETS